MSYLQRLITLNPVFHKEMRTRWRGRKLYLIPGLAFGGLLALLIVTMLPGAFDRDWFFDVYPSIAAFLAYFIAGAIALLATPGLTAGSLAVERANLTLDALVLTRLSTWQIIMGKFAAGMVPVLLSFLPCLSIASFMSLLAVVSDSEDFFTEFYNLHAYLQWITVPLIALAAGALGTAVSAFCRQLRSAMAWAYGLTLTLYFGVQHGPTILAMIGLIDFERPSELADFLTLTVVPWCIYALVAVAAIRLAHWRLHTEPSRD
ncbi:MAG: hypothetical protein ACE5R4_06870 [Armatimonadota bacterium]